jgi:tetratricopeptide (TPR) repeat protein
MSSEYERKLIDMQYQMRENNSYLNDYMKDLNVWTDEIKKKEQNLKTTTTNSNLTPSKDLPPVRNFIEPPKPKRKSKKKNLPSKPSSSIHAYDYRSWDKFDVDAECERIDNEDIEGDDEGDDEDEDENDEQWQEEVLKKKAEYYKDCGNYQFKQKSYAEAIEFYTKAIECNPTSPIYFANRAQCQLFEQRYGACEADCTLAIQLDKNYLKAYYRRALARIELGKIEQARQDLEYVIAREPANNDAKNKLDEMNKNEEIKRLGRVYPLQSKPIEKRSTKPLKRIEIEEIDTSIISSSETTKKKSIVIEEMDTVGVDFLEFIPNHRFNSLGSNCF